jgi:alpha-D-ribose 1-methylphosphonate 5-triphosphate diphosphatase
VGFFRIASTNPARVLGLSDRGILAPGKRADIVVCNDDMSIRDVFVSCGGASGV